jgi:hypothetical protein
MATIRQAMTLLGQQGIDDETRHEMIYRFTGGRTTSIRDLSTKELEQFCNRLQEKTADREILMRQKRSVVLTLATRTGIKEPDSWTNFNRWMLNSSKYKKALTEYDFEELDELTAQFRGLESNYKKSADKAGTKAWHHKTGIPRPSEN